MEGMINFDGLKITEEVATKYLWEINPDAAPTEGVDFFQMYSEGWRGKGAQDSIDNLLNWILNGVTWSIDEKNARSGSVGWIPPILSGLCRLLRSIMGTCRDR